MRANNRPVDLYVYRGTDRDSDVPWQDERCGTYAGAMAHSYLREKLCDPCKAARADYMRLWRLRTGRVKTIRVRPTPQILALLGTESSRTAC